MNLAAGQYTLDVEYPTDCDWTVNIYDAGAAATTVSVATGPPTISILRAALFVRSAANFEQVTVVAVGQRFYLVISYKATGDLPATLTGQVTLRKDHQAGRSLHLVVPGSGRPPGCHSRGAL